MLTELKLIEESRFQTPEPAEECNSHILFGSLVNHIGFEGEPLKFDYKGKILEVRGILEDYKIVLDGKLVGEVVYDNFYNLSENLINELMK